MSVIGASVICVFLALLLVITPFYYSVTALTKPETVVKIIKKVDYERLIEENSTAKKLASSLGINAKAANELMKSRQAERTIEVYADEAVELLMQIPASREWNSALVKEIVNDNMDKIVDIAKENTSLKISEKALKKSINSTIDSNSELIDAAAPVLEQVRIIVQTVKASELIRRSMTPQFAVMLAAVFVLSAAAVCLLRKKGFYGFLWLAIVFFVAVLLLGIIAIYSKSGFVNRLALGMSDFGTEILTSAVSVYVEKLVVALLCSLTMGFIMMIIFVLGHKPAQNSVESAAERPAEVAGE